MQVAVERLPGSKVALTITVEPEAVQQKTEQLFQQHARRVAIPGFRPGKAPRRLLEERVNMKSVQQDAVEALIDVSYKQALDEEKLHPLERGDVDDLNLADDQTLTYTVTVCVRPEITLPDYADISVSLETTVITDAAVDAEIERVRERLAEHQEITDSGIEVDDYVTIDYTMTVDGEPYPEGDASGYPLEVGTDTLFPELNEGLLGAKLGDIVTIKKSYPADYSTPELAGKTAEFAITVQEIRRNIKPEATDAWASTITQGTIETMEELRERVKENLQSAAMQSDRENLRNQIVRKMVEASTLELPETLVDDEYEHLMTQLENELAHRRMTMDEMLDSNGMTEDIFQDSQRTLAKNMVRRSLVLQEIGTRENLLVTEEEIDGTLAALSSDTSVKAMRKELEKSGRMDGLVGRIFHEKVLTLLENKVNVIIDGVETTSTPSGDALDGVVESDGEPEVDEVAAEASTE